MDEETSEEFALYLNHDDGEVRILIEHAQDSEIVLAIQMKDDEAHHRLLHLLVDNLAGMLEDSMSHSEVIQQIIEGADPTTDVSSSDAEPPPVDDLEMLWTADSVQEPPHSIGE